MTLGNDRSQRIEFLVRVGRRRRADVTGRAPAEEVEGGVFRAFLENTSAASGAGSRRQFHRVTPLAWLNR